MFDDNLLPLGMGSEFLFGHGVHREWNYAGFCLSFGMAAQRAARMILCSECA